jgi:hypothetical protein
MKDFVQHKVATAFKGLQLESWLVQNRQEVSNMQREGSD